LGARNRFTVLDPGGAHQKSKKEKNKQASDWPVKPIVVFHKFFSVFSINYSRWVAIKLHLSLQIINT
jgi:hypothetical protein